MTIFQKTTLNSSKHCELTTLLLLLLYYSESRFLNAEFYTLQTLILCSKLKLWNMDAIQMKVGLWRQLEKNRANGAEMLRLLRRSLWVNKVFICPELYQQIAFRSLNFPVFELDSCGAESKRITNFGQAVWKKCTILEGLRHLWHR